MYICNSIWSVGDFCLYKPDPTEEYVLGAIKLIDVENNLCVIASCMSNMETKLPPGELLSLTPDTIKHKQLDASYFGQKLEKLGCVFSGQAMEKLPKSTPFRPHKSANSSWQPGNMCICTWSEDESYYFAIISEADHQKDRFLVTFCYYNNTEIKRSADLHELGSDFELLVEDELNKLAAEKLRKSQTLRKKVGSANLEDGNETADKYTNLLTFNTNDEDLAAAGINTAVTKEGDSQSCKPAHSKPKIRPKPDPTVNQNQFISTPSKTGVYGGDQNTAGVAPPLSGTLPPSFATPSALRPPLPNNLPGTEQAPWQALLISWFMCGYHTGYFEALHSKNKSS
ncbi:hypothetical protein EG68_08213 [Paragonimus skrjabini miyazakii]|uniref:Tudor domain-containing protein n=1 Tax=Paragonimus skrjabini miyazakii TaxID=59628 RepID=A0A8S9YKG3_9TREM|nr:hypothetical protein EG68_08213 [Paragonimus skrjabini miyazakii]